MAIAARERHQQRSAVAAWCAIAIQLLGCDANVVIANRSCPPRATSSLLATAGAAGNTASATGSAGAASASVEFPWATGFEDGFCDYSALAGFCIHPNSNKRIIAEPVHSGQYAAEYTVDSSLANNAWQSRCVLVGAFPTAANYGAWYFIPVLPKKVAIWNIFHFQGGNSTAEKYHDLWDVTFVLREDGKLHLTLYNFNRGALPDQSNTPAVPIGQWVHINLYVKRAADTTGEFLLSQDGAAIAHVTGVATDDTRLGQWYVGNYAKETDPIENTVYVDDVEVSPVR